MIPLIKNNTGLEAPQDYWDASYEDKYTIVNGCGPHGVLEDLIPDSFFTMNISETCNIHDWMWDRAKNKIDFYRADQTFLENIKTEIENHKSSKLVKYARCFLAQVYYFAVRIYGHFNH